MGCCPSRLSCGPGFGNAQRSAAMIWRSTRAAWGDKGAGQGHKQQQQSAARSRQSLFAAPPSRCRASAWRVRSSRTDSSRSAFRSSPTGIALKRWYLARRERSTFASRSVAPPNTDAPIAHARETDQREGSWRPLCQALTRGPAAPCRSASPRSARACTQRRWPGAPGPSPAARWAGGRAPAWETP